VSPGARVAGLRRTTRAHGRRNDFSPAASTARWRDAPIRLAASTLAAAAATIAVALIGGAEARANHIAGATYNGTTSEGGTVSFTVSADGSGIVIARIIDPGPTCNFETIIRYYTASGDPLPIVNHAFSDPNERFQFQGSFPGPESAEGTFTAGGEHSEYTPTAHCASTLSWSASTKAPPDTRPPETTITNEVPNRTEKSTVRFKFRSDESRSAFECRRDEKPWRRCSSPKTVKGLDEGAHTFRVRATDLVGNTDPTPAKERFKVVEG
jgi:hypothetical protein